MLLQDIHSKVFNLISKDSLIAEEDIYYIFPPKDKLKTFPCIHFRTENIKSMSLGDDEEYLTSLRLVVDIYDTKPIFEVADTIIKNMFEDTEIIAEMEASSESYYSEDCIFGKNLTFNIKFLI